MTKTNTTKTETTTSCVALCNEVVKTIHPHTVTKKCAVAIGKLLSGEKFFAVKVDDTEWESGRDPVTGKMHQSHGKIAVSALYESNNGKIRRYRLVFHKRSDFENFFVLWSMGDKVSFRRLLEANLVEASDVTAAMEARKANAKTAEVTKGTERLKIKTVVAEIAKAKAAANAVNAK